MPSPSADPRDEARRDVASLTPDERVRLALQLSERAIQYYMSSHGVDRTEALRRMRASRSLGRTPSVCLETE